MRNALPRKPLQNESAVVNLDDVKGPGSHWVAYKKRANAVEYFDSFGNLRPPLELIRYLGPNCSIEYNTRKYQGYDQFNCGHLCLQFLSSRPCKQSCRAPLV